MHLAFTCMDHYLALPLEKLGGVGKGGVALDAPGLPEYVLGLGADREYAYPLIDLAVLLGLDKPGRDEPIRRVFLERNDGQLICLAVDSLVGLIRVSSDEIKSIPGDDCLPYVNSYSEIEGIRYYLPDPDALAMGPGDQSVEGYSAAPRD